MKARITGHSETGPKWWYAQHFGEVFEVEDDPERDKYFYTSIPGSPHKHHILKCDCEVIE